MIWQMILRNIIRNRKNSLVIFLLIALISSLFFIGNSIIGQTNAGLKKTYVDSLTADVVIQKNGNISMNLFGANSPVIDDYAAIPVLPAYDHVMGLVSAENAVEDCTSQVSGMAAMKIPDAGGGNEGVLLCGVDPESYFDCFPGIVIEQGRTLEPGEYGVMITAERADRLERETGIRPVPDMPVLLTSAGTLGFRIREVPLRGIYRYRNPGQFMEEIVIADPQTVRVLQAIQVATAESSGEDEESILDDPESFFTGAGDHPDEYTDEGFSPELLGDILASGEEVPELSGGDWNFILLRLKDGVPPPVFIKTLNAKLAPYGVYAAGWRTAAGTSAIMMLLVQAFFNLGGFLVSIAGGIVVVNILLISVFRRTREIGTLRAIGASASYIRRLIMGENCCIALLAGIAGVAAGAAFLGMINSLNIEIPNALTAALLGGRILRIDFLPVSAAASFCIALFLGAAASLYPVETAVRIDPVTAVRQG